MIDLFKKWNVLHESSLKLKILKNSGVGVSFIENSLRKLRFNFKLTSKNNNKSFETGTKTREITEQLHMIFIDRFYFDD